MNYYISPNIHWINYAFIFNGIETSTVFWFYGICNFQQDFTKFITDCHPFLNGCFYRISMLVDPYILLAISSICLPSVPQHPPKILNWFIGCAQTKISVIRILRISMSMQNTMSLMYGFKDKHSAIYVACVDCRF